MEKVKKANIEIREAAKQKKVRLWELADALSVSEMTVTRRLRHELPASDRRMYLRLIRAIANRRTMQNEPELRNQRFKDSVSSGDRLSG